MSRTGFQTTCNARYPQDCAVIRRVKGPVRQHLVCWKVGNPQPAPMRPWPSPALAGPQAQPQSLWLRPGASVALNVPVVQVSPSTYAYNITDYVECQGVNLNPWVHPGDLAAVRCQAGSSDSELCWIVSHLGQATPHWQAAVTLLQPSPRLSLSSLGIHYD